MKKRRVTLAMVEYRISQIVYRLEQAGEIRRAFKVGRSMDSLARQYGRRIVERAIRAGL